MFTLRILKTTPFYNGKPKKETMTSLIIQVLYFLFPVAIANMMPVLVRPYFRRLNYPLDHHKTIFGKRILGTNKTFRGLAFGIIGGIVASFIQQLLMRFPFFHTISFVPYDQINILAYGFLLGLGVIVGDATGSFVKRMNNIKPGDSFMPMDQIVAPIGAMLFILPLYKVSLKIFLVAIFISFFAHIIIKYIGYVLKIDRRKW